MKWIALFLIVSIGTASGDLEATTGVPKGDPEMEAAFVKARSETDKFITILNARAADSYYVKVKIVDGNEVEYFWLDHLTFKNGAFYGTIDNDPEHVHNVRNGQDYVVKKEEIFDWLYTKDGKMYGNYTLRANLKRLSPKDAADARAMLAPE